MRMWFGVLLRTCIEFLLLLVLGCFIAGLARSLAMDELRAGALFVHTLHSSLELMPVAATAALFFSFFGFERRVRSRSAGWAGAFLLGILFLSGTLALRRLPLTEALLPAAPAPTALQGPGQAVRRGQVLLWYREGEGSAVRDAAVVDFGASFPRLAYAGYATVDPADGAISIGGKRYGARAPRPFHAPLLPELRWFEGSWIWERLAAADDAPLVAAASAALGFVLLALGCRFLARFTRWPLANAFFALAGFLGLFVLDAALAGPSVSSLLSALASRLGLALPSSAPGLLVAGTEAILGLLLGAIDLAIVPLERRTRG